MGIFDRFSTLLRSNINDLISRAENPEKMLNQLIVDMKGQLAKAKQQVASAIADEKKLQSDAEAMKKQAEDWERRAMLAVQEGRDDMAKQALGRYNEQLQGAQQLHETWLKHKAETEQLKLALRQLLEYNARELVHGSYGLEGAHIVLTDTLELENLDFSEFEASLDSITLALASHLGALAPYRER